MKESVFDMDLNDNDSRDSFDFMKFIKRFFSYWPWFLLSILLSLLVGYFYLRYSPMTYASVAKIKIIDDSSETDIAKDPLSAVWANPQINMDNEIAVLQSYKLLSQVVDSLQLNIAYYKPGSIRNIEIWETPFQIVQVIPNDSIQKARSFYVKLDVAGFKIVDDNNTIYDVPYFDQNHFITELPFNITLLDGIKVSEYKEQEYLVVMYPFKQSVINLTNSLSIQPWNKKGEILGLWLFGESSLKSEQILNKIIEVFNYDGIKDRQQVSKRTLEFIDERFGYLTQELDSIEGGKQNFKIENNLSYIEADADNSLMRKSNTEQDVNGLETQISLAKSLKSTIISQGQYMLLPVNIGIENVGLNALVANYNEMALERDKLIASVGESHPTLIAISSQLERSKINILKTVNVYETQLRTSLNRLNQEKSKANSIFSELPEKEKRLRAIERQQSIKENLFLLLLQKREEAAISLAVTAPSIKVVDYGITNDTPISPKKKIIMGMAGLFGVMLPFLILYIKFAVDNSVHDRSDFKNLPNGIPLLSEVPNFKENKIFTNLNDRSLLSESFRILATNIKYKLPKNTKAEGQTIFITSADTGEGKSLISHNLSVAFTSLNKKVLLVGADLRNPQLHTFFGVSNNTRGLTDYLQDPTIKINDIVFKGLQESNLLSVCLSGNLPHNAPQLLALGFFEDFIAEAKKNFDFIIVDTAPTEPVTDTFLISNCADITLYIMRAGVTNKKVFKVAENLGKEDKLMNMVYVVNDVASRNTKAYKYGYGTS